MSIPKELRDNFQHGKTNLVDSSALLNPYARWMQSPNIPRVTKTPICLDSLDDIVESDPDIKEYLKKIKTETTKREIFVPTFFPCQLRTKEYYAGCFKCPYRYIHALMVCHNKNYQLFSEQSQKDFIQEIILNATTDFKKIYDVSVFRLYKKKKSQIYDTLSNLKPTVNKTFKNESIIATLHIIGESLNKNIIIVRKFNYEWACIFKPERETYILWEDGIDVGFLCHMNRIPIDIYHILSSKLDIDSNRTILMKISSNDDKKKELIKIKHMNYEDLKDYAIKLEVGVLDEVGKILKKQTLLNKIIESIVE